MSGDRIFITTGKPKRSAAATASAPRWRRPARAPIGCRLSDASSRFASASEALPRAASPRAPPAAVPGGRAAKAAPSGPSRRSRPPRASGPRDRPSRRLPVHRMRSGGAITKAHRAGRDISSAPVQARASRPAARRRGHGEEAQHRGIAAIAHQRFGELAHQRDVVAHLRGRIHRIARRAERHQVPQPRLRVLRHLRHRQADAFGHVADQHARRRRTR
jgi:hypothetical protein